MKQFLFCILFSLPLFSFAQTSSRESKKVSKEINKSIDEITTVLENTDWSALSDLLNKTLQVVEKNADVIADVIARIDIEKMANNVEKIAVEIEKNIDTKKIEETANRIADKFEEARKDEERKAEKRSR